jgi:hypothetical protein
MKYKAIKTIVDGHKFDSKLEAKRYSELKLWERAGEINSLVLQPRFELQPAFDKNGVHYRKIEYVADFSYYDKRHKRFVIEDSKGYKTDVYSLKKKLFEFNFPDYTITEVN